MGTKKLSMEVLISLCVFFFNRTQLTNVFNFDGWDSTVCLGPRKYKSNFQIINNGKLPYDVICTKKYNNPEKSMA